MSKAPQKQLSVEARLAALEREFETLRDALLGFKPAPKDWRATVGMMPDNATSRSAARLGEVWRQQQRTH